MARVGSARIIIFKYIYILYNILFYVEQPGSPELAGGARAAAATARRQRGGAGAVRGKCNTLLCADGQLVYSDAEQSPGSSPHTSPPPSLGRRSPMTPSSAKASPVPPDPSPAPSPAPVRLAARLYSPLVPAPGSAAPSPPARGGLLDSLEMRPGSGLARPDAVFAPTPLRTSMRPEVDMAMNLDVSLSDTGADSAAHLDTFEAITGDLSCPTMPSSMADAPVVPPASLTAPSTTTDPPEPVAAPATASTPLSIAGDPLPSAVPPLQVDLLQAESIPMHTEPPQTGPVTDAVAMETDSAPPPNPQLDDLNRQIKVQVRC